MKIGSQKLQKQFRDGVVSINEAIGKNPELISHQASAMKELEGAYLEAVNRMEDEKIKNIVANLASSMETSITDMIMNIGNGANSLKDTVKDMARAILAEFIKIQVARPAANFLAGMTSSLFSFDGGGYTGSGSRSGGIDGKGGFQAVLHPNETVVDHTKGQGVSQGGETNVSVSFNITANDTQGFDNLLDSRRGMIVGIINQAMNDRGMTGVTA
jgi:DNA-binding cell septation regulator SpoVG